MFKVMKTADDRFKVIDEMFTFEGDLDAVKGYLKDELQVDAEEISFALDTMRLQKHDTAHFGVNFTFTHSSDSRSVGHVVAELRAIRDLRKEFTYMCSKYGDAVETKEVHARLISLYAALNVDAILTLVDPVGESKAA
jgi:hypothetical protein